MWMTREKTFPIHHWAPFKGNLYNFLEILVLQIHGVFENKNNNNKNIGIPLLAKPKTSIRKKFYLNIFWCENHFS